MFIHGIETNAYDTWRGMRQRCENPKHPKYASYGARGIFVCPEWQDFLTFHADMGERPTLGHSIDRIDNNGPYTPDNCKWGTKVEQVRNRRSSPFVEHEGETMHLADAAKSVGITYQKAIRKLYQGEDFDAPSMKMTRLTKTEAGEVKWLLQNTTHPPLSVAAAYNVCEAMVLNIRSGRQWSEVVPVATDRLIPLVVRASTAKYILAMSDWKAPYEITADVGPLPRGFLTRLCKSGLIKHGKANNTFKATPEALAAAFRVVTCEE